MLSGGLPARKSPSYLYAVFSRFRDMVSRKYFRGQGRQDVPHANPPLTVMKNCHSCYGLVLLGPVKVRARIDRCALGRPTNPFSRLTGLGRGHQ
jgi:hypothetical protein